MLDYELLMQLVVVAIMLSCVTTAFIQMTKGMFKTSKYITLYSLFVNMSLAVPFCISFTKASTMQSLWVGLFSFIGADSLYKALEGKLKSHSEIIKNDVTVIERDDK